MSTKPAHLIPIRAAYTDDGAVWLHRNGHPLTCPHMSPALVVPATRVHGTAPVPPVQQFHLCSNACALFKIVLSNFPSEASSARVYQDCSHHNQEGHLFDEQATRTESDNDTPVITLK
jgi:hypothetical protein